jgi:hypothetical protein
MTKIYKSARNRIVKKEDNSGLWGYGGAMGTEEGNGNTFNDMPTKRGYSMFVSVL